MKECLIVPALQKERGLSQYMKYSEGALTPKLKKGQLLHHNATQPPRVIQKYGYTCISEGRLGVTSEDEIRMDEPFRIDAKLERSGVNARLESQISCS